MLPVPFSSRDSARKGVQRREYTWQSRYPTRTPNPCKLVNHSLFIASITLLLEVVTKGASKTSPHFLTLLQLLRGMRPTTSSPIHQIHR